MKCPPISIIIVTADWSNKVFLFVNSRCVVGILKRLDTCLLVPALLLVK